MEQTDDNPGPFDVEHIDDEPDLAYAERYADQLVSNAYKFGADAETALVVAVIELRKMRLRLAQVRDLVVVGSRLGDGSPVYLDVRGRDLVEALREGT